MGQQHLLRRMQTMLAEKSFHRLAPGPSARLRPRPANRARPGAGAPAEALHAFGNCAGGYQHHFMPAGSERGNLFAQLPSASWSSPAPWLVTRLLPTLTTMRLHWVNTVLMGAGKMPLRVGSCAPSAAACCSCPPSLQQVLHDGVVNSFLQPSPLIAEMAKWRSKSPNSL